jgi:tetratricopeptide (TPR) repeat protein
VRLRLASASLVLLAAHGAAAQALQLVDPPRLVVPAGESPVQLAALDIRVVVDGFAAETTETLTFRNPNPRPLEGNLEFPLPDGAALCGFALDFEGRLVDGVVLPREKARVALEAEIRRGVDPGLVEQVRGNVHRARVYPIPARGTRTVRLRWVSALTTRGDEAAYHLPLPYRQAIPEVTLRVEVVRAPAAPEVLGGFGTLSPERIQDRWVAEGRIRDGAAQRDLLVRLPRLPERWLAAEAGEGGETFFALAERVPALAKDVVLPPPRRIAVAWDASGSRDAAATGRELGFLRKVLAAWPNAAVDLVVFRDRPERPQAFAAGERDRLEATLRAAPADGGTALGGLDLRRRALPHPDDALWILLSDGLGTLGEALPSTDDVPVWTATGATEADRPLLRHVATRTGGELVDLVAQQPEAAAASVGRKRIRLAQVTASPEGAVEDLQLRPGADPAWAQISGRLLRPEAELTLVFATGSAPVERRTVKVRAEGAARGDGPGPVAVWWAQGRAEELGLFADRNEAELLSLGRRFGLVTAGTSILVLETLEQHLQHGVEPAATRPELRAQYLARSAELARQKRAAERSALEAVVRAWQERVAWWEKSYQVPPGWRWTEPKAVRGGRNGGRLRLGFQSDGEALEEADSSGIAGAPSPSAAPAESRMLRSAAPAKSKAGGEETATAASIAIQPWDPQVPYLAALKAAAPAAAYAAYLSERERHAGPAFFLDCAGFFLRAGQRELGIRVLSNLAELRLDDAALLRVLAWRLSEAGELDLAVEVLEKVRRLRPEEPQSRRDLAQVLADRAEAQDRPADAARAVALLWEVGRRRWESTPDIEIVSLMELNRILARAERHGWAEVARGAEVDGRLRKLMTVDLRVSLSWDADLTDVDLHLFEPTAEHASYSHQRTRMGGLVSRDVTGGYGPEEYLVRRALPGDYAIKVHYYGSGQQTVVGPATMIATVYTNWGRPEERRQVLTLRLDAPRELEQVGVVKVGAGAGR